MVNPLRSSGGVKSGRAGEPLVFVTGGALLLLLIMLFGVVFLLSWNSLGVFWPQPIERIEQADGPIVLGQFWRRENVPQSSEQAERKETQRTRSLYRTGNRREFDSEFAWVEDDRVVSRTQPADAIYLERLEWGPAIGRIHEIRRDGAPLADVGPTDFDKLEDLIDEARSERTGTRAPTVANAHLVAQFELSDGRMTEVPLAAIVRAVPANALSTMERVGVYLARAWEFVSADPRESNTEGGIFPAIMGTCLMVLLMTIAVVPFGVIGALYLNEYARQGAFVRFVRLAVNNLAGVPSIVFGMFGLAFFVYTVGSSVDSFFFADKLPTPTFGTGGLLWASLTLALLTVPVVIVSTEEGLRAVARAQREGSLALGATRWQAIRTVVLPAALPGILTGVILAIARGAGEVAPLMLTGVVKLAPSPLVDGTAPYLHTDAKFMHLGFHIYDVGFQSPNVEASKPLVYMTALLLLVLIVCLNLTAILYRNRVRRRLAGSTF